MAGCIGQVWRSIIKVFTIGEKSENEKYMQPEIWNKILLKLWENEEDLETLLTCRLVCRSWKKLIDEMPPKPHWNPWLRDDIRARDIFERAPATNFKKREDFRQFSSLMAELSPDEAKKNPFCNKTVKLFDHPDKMNSKEMEKLLKILREHGHHIHQLYYVSTHPILNEKELRISPLLRTMSNLRTLAVNFLNTREEERRYINFPKDLENLEELVIIGGRGVQRIGRWCMILNRTTPICEKFFSSYGSQIKSVTLDHWSLTNGANKDIYIGFPNLEEFKVEYLHVACVTFWNESFGTPWPKLKRLALGTPTLTEDSLEFIKVLMFVRCFSKTLQVLSLDLIPAKSKLQHLPGNHLDPRLEMEEGPMNPNLNPFPNLEKLIVPFHLMVLKPQSLLDTLDRRLNLRVPFLKYIILEDVGNRFKHRKNFSDAELSEICRHLLPLPPSVKTVCLRKLRRNEQLKRDFPVIYKCQ